MAVDEINAAGGIKGIGKIELLVEDDQGKPADASAAALKLITRDKIDFLMAACGGSVPTMPVVPIHTRYEIINLNSCASSKQVTMQGSKWIFRTQQVSDRTVAGILDFAQKELGAKRIGIISETSEYGRAAAEAGLEHLKAAGRPAVAHEQYARGDKTFSAQLLKLKEAGVDAVGLFGYLQEASLILKQMRQLGLAVPVVSTDVLSSPQFVSLAGEDSNGVAMTVAWTKDTSDPRSVEFIEKYRKRFGEDPVVTAPMAYDAVYLMKWAYEKAGTKDKFKVRDALAGVSGFSGLTGEAHFDQRGDDTRPFLVVVIHDGKFVPYEEWKKLKRR
jgi:branched-chain amino acid transport system substrate-binding protein